MEEVWKDIKGYEGLYQVSNLGRVKSLPRNTTSGKILKQIPTNGYLYVRLSKDGSVKLCLVHRLVAEAFIPNPNNLPEVNHKSEEKWLNTVENLEYCDRSYNINYGNRNKRVSEIFSRAVKQLSLDGTLVAIWPSLIEAQRNGYSRSSISRCCNGKYTQHKGYKWEWVC